MFSYGLQPSVFACEQDMGPTERGDMCQEFR